MEALFATLKINQDQRFSTFKAEQEKRFDRLKSLIISMSRGKAITEDATTSHPSPTSGNTSIPRQQIEPPNFDGNDPVGCIAWTEQYFTLH